jgi:hypothetical protein
MNVSLIWRRLFRAKKALSEVVTTLIILTFAVLLALTVITYTNGLTRAKMKSTGGEIVRFYKTHAWVMTINGTDEAVIAFKLYNLGGKIISIEMVNLRGTEIDWPDIYYHCLSSSREASRDLNITDHAMLSGTSTIIDGINYTQATGNIYVKAGGMLLVYIKSPPMIRRDNIGQPIIVAVGTQNANFITEIIVETAYS